MATPKQCRVCYTSNKAKENPLISPCDCKGSLGFIHLRCLQQWILIDPQKNGFFCEICMSDYDRSYIPQLERIPGRRDFRAIVLEFPILFAIIIHYVYFFHLSLTRIVFDYQAVQLYVFYQWVFQVLYAVSFAANWKVRNIDLYLRHLQKKEILLFPLFHGFCLVLLHKGFYFIGPTLDIFLGSYYSKHIMILTKMNDQITNGELL